jgi:uncharacterized protein YcfL
MKKTLFVVIVLFLIAGCQTSKEVIKKEEPQKSLTELQVLACETADEAGTCDTRLMELGIILKEDCCEVIGKCC